MEVHMEKRVAAPASPDPSAATTPDAGSGDEPSPAAHTSDARTGERPTMIPWAPLAVPLMAAVVACVAYSVGWLVLQR